MFQRRIDQKDNKKKLILKVVKGDKVIGSVRAFKKDDSCCIEKLMVHPDYQNRGIGKVLIKEIEDCFDCGRYELFTGHLSEKNLELYEKLGYQRIKTERVSDGLDIIYLEKLKVVG
jgi:GNAT superfamily N-acetyltransferase